MSQTIRFAGSPAWRAVPPRERRSSFATLALTALLTPLATAALAADAPADSAWAEKARACAASARELRFFAGERWIEPEFFSVDPAGIRCEAPRRTRYWPNTGSSLTAYPRPASIELQLVPWSEVSRVDIRSSKPGGGGGAVLGMLIGGGLGALLVASSPKPEGIGAIFAAEAYATAMVAVVGVGALLGAIIGAAPHDTGWVTCCRREPLAAVVEAAPPAPAATTGPAEAAASEPDSTR